MRTLPAGLLLVALLAPAPYAVGSTAAEAHTHQVNSEADSTDARTGDGVCADAAGRCTLRAAIVQANATGGADLIRLPAGHYRLTIPSLTSQLVPGLGDPLPLDASRGDLDILGGTVTIAGAGAGSTVIDAQGIDRVLTTVGTTTLTDLTVTGGKARSKELVLVAGGGGIANAGLLTLDRVVVTGNDGTDYGGGIFSVPGTHMDIRNSTISDNVAGEAGGVRVDWTADFVNSTVSGNRALAERSANPTPGVAGRGGGIDGRGVRITLRHTTVTGNHASGGGGGINMSYAYLDALPDGLTGLLPVSLGPGFVELGNSIVAGNTSGERGGDCHATLATFRSLGGNVDGDGTCSLRPALGDTTADPGLAPLTAIGELLVHPLLATSAAIGRALAATCVPTDQLGRPRPAEACDAGAVQHRD